MTDTRLAALMQIAAESFEPEATAAEPIVFESQVVPAETPPRPGMFSPDQQQTIIKLFDF